ncbi:MAG: CBS domain-containing protein [Spirochaetales bacterium]|nr:CBS domain-containing protein [Spirochaetales bacterium]
MMVSDVMTSNPLYVHPDLSVTEARNLMRKEKVGQLLVLDRANKLVGIVTERDLINASPSEATTLSIFEISSLLASLKVEQVMTRKVISVDESVVIEEAARIMVDNGISALPVMKGDIPVGIVSDGDLFRLFINLFGARQNGLRISMLVPEKKGELHDLAEVLTQKGANVLSMVICDGCDVTNRMCIMKVSDISKEDLLDAVKPCSLKVVDIR